MNKTLLTATLAAGFCVTTMAQDFKWQPFYTQTYENVAQIVDVWIAPSNQGGLSLAEENGNHYVYYDHGNNNSRGLYNTDALTAEMYEGIDEYRVEFDLALTPGNNQFSTFAVGGPDIQTMGSDWVTPCGNITKYPNNGLGSGALFALIQESANNNNWVIYSQGPLGSNNWIDNESPEAKRYITLENGVFYHFAITVAPHEVTEAEGWTNNVTVEVVDMSGEPVAIWNADANVEENSFTLPYTDEGNGAWFKQFYVLSGRYYSIMKMDNVQVMKKVSANSVTPPTLSMTGVRMEGRVIALDNGIEADNLIPYYAIVDEATYLTAESAAELTGIEYTAPFVVDQEVNYVLAWNVDEAGHTSELTHYTCEAGWAPKLNAPTVSAIDYNGYKKTFQATCDQSTVKPLAPLSYTIYMSADSVNWEETSTYTVLSGNVYAKVEADGYAPAGSAPVEAPEGVYGSTKWTIAGMVVTDQDCVLESTGETYLNFGNSGKGRVHVPVQYWSEDYVSEDGEVVYDAENAWAPLKKNGFHFSGGSGDMFILGSGNASGFTVTGIAAYNSKGAKIKIDNLNEGDIIQVNYSDGTAQVLTVNDPETFTVAVPQYKSATGTNLASIAIKGAGTVETRTVKAGEWGIIASSRTVADVEQAGADFYEHVYTVYNSDTQSADTLLLKPVNALVAGNAYIYHASADEIELVTLEAEEPADEQTDEQMEYENYTLYSTLDEEMVDRDLYTMYPGGILMRGEDQVEVPMYSGYFLNLDDPSNYSENLDFKLQGEYTAFLAAVNKAIEDYENKEPEWGEDENGDPILIDKPALDVKALYEEKYNALLSNYTVVPVVHKYDQKVADAIAAALGTSDIVDVVTPAGIVVRRGVKASEALNGLKHGLYIVAGRKIAK